MRKLFIAAIALSACTKPLYVPAVAPAPKARMPPPAAEPPVSKPPVSGKPVLEPPVSKPAVSGQSSKKPETKEAPKPANLNEALAALEDFGWSRHAEIIQSRVNQQKKKRKLTEDQGFQAAIYLLEDLPAMENTGQLAEQLPKATIELLRGVHERGVEKQDAEEISAYLLKFLESMKLGHPEKFDENLSHCIGRQWHEIDYSGEGMTWQKAKAVFTRKGVIDFRKAEYVQKYFEWESTQGYFRKIYQPRGRLPD